MHKITIFGYSLLMLLFIIGILLIVYSPKEDEGKDKQRKITLSIGSLLIIFTVIINSLLLVPFFMKKGKLQFQRAWTKEPIYKKKINRNYINKNDYIDGVNYTL